MFFKPANLTYLNLSRNYFGGQLSNSQSEFLLQEQTFLKTLDLGHNGIIHLPDGFLDPFIRLQRLDLPKNELQDITFNLHFVHRLFELQKLDLSGNKMKLLSANTMRDLDSVGNGHLAIDLSQNNLLCSCDYIAFPKWIQHHIHKKSISFEHLPTYICTFPNSERRNFSDMANIIARLEKQCASYIGLIVGCATAATIVLVTISAAVIYKHRWKIRYFYYIAKRSYRGNKHHTNDNYRKLFCYDAFISYSSDDRPFAFIELQNKIEGHSDLKLCFHERDFLPGFNIAENIANAIHDSRKVVCIVSNNFLASDWCMYEFNMALMERIHARDGRNVLFLVLLKEFDTRKAPLPMLQFIRSNSYVEFPGDKSCQSMFWTKMIEAISTD